MRRTLVILLLLAAATLYSNNVITHGVLDLKEYSFDTGKILNIKGEAHFFWGELISPKDISWENQEFSPIPGSWLNDDQNNYPNFGEGTYGFKMLLPPGRLWGLWIGETASAMALFINGERVFSLGDIQNDTYKPRIESELIFLGELPEESEVVIQIKNSTHSHGGIWEHYRIGLYPDMVQWEQRTAQVDLFLMGALASLGTFFIFISFRRNNRSSLFLGLFCLMLALRTGITNHKFFYPYLEFIPWEILYRIEYLTLLSGFLFFSIFTHHQFPGNFSEKFMQAVKWSVLALSLTIALPILVFSSLLIYTYFAMAIFVLVALYLLIRNFELNRAGFVLYFTGLIFLFLGIIQDFILSRFFTLEWRLMPYSLIIFVLFQSSIILKTIIKVFSEIGRLAGHWEKVNKAFLHFLPKPFLESLGKSDVQNIALGDHIKKDMYLLFLDIRSFTDLAEVLSPEETFDLLNKYWYRIGPHIRNHGGWIERYIGDALLALFDRNPREVLEAAIQIQREISLINQENWNDKPIRIGISLHQGAVVMGLVGEKARVQGTVIGNSVTTVTAVEDFSKVFQTKILMTQDFFKSLEDPTLINYLFLGQVLVPGQDVQVGLYSAHHPSCDDHFENRDTIKSSFERGMVYYHMKEFKEAIECFKEVLSIQEDHAPTKVYLSRSEYYLNNPPDDPWSGAVQIRY